MPIKESIRFSLICAVVFVQYIILIANINNFTSLHKEKGSIESNIKKSEAEQINNLEDVKRELNNEFNKSGVDNNSLVKTSPNNIEKLLTPQEIEVNNQKSKQKSNIVIQ